MFAIGFNELKKLPNSVREEATCPKCYEQHKILYGTKVMSDGPNIPTKMLGYVQCGDKKYLVAIDEKLL